jgi:hypothetical protein
MFCGSGFTWGGWHMGGYFMPGLLILILFGAFAWFFLKRQQTVIVSTSSCPKCSGNLQASYFRCPHCGETLKHNCPNCSRVIEHNWSYCPYCNEPQTSNAC